MEKPTPEQFGYQSQVCFDGDKSGWILEGGEEALKRWKFMQDNGLGEEEKKAGRPKKQFAEIKVQPKAISERAMEDLQNQTWEQMPQWQKNDYKLTGGRPRVSEYLAESFHERFKHDKLGRKLTNAVNELSDTYNDVRFGLRRGALIGGLGLGALALSNRKKENTPSSSGRMNKSMAKRAMPTKAQSPSNKYL
jgi:hypothetical protein